ncbi:MAG: exodeoxyribonuclease I [Thiotrichales bacterium]|nr:MAG: exodeoxyribonuclease I [Thiotrichales bacterium]
MANSIYWYDYETFGTDPRYDRLAQFAGLRTDEELNVIGDPLVMYCKPADDMLPDPMACLVTGITPQKALSEGLIEAEFIAAIHQEFSRPGTCVAGYNNIRFDDEFTRYTLYRNFYNAYSHEWQHGNSRWDIIDMVRLTRALRPEGIEWPFDDQGKPSNRLELLTVANGISHESAHDAMSDVYATIAIARLIREKQPRLYDYVYQHRRKDAVAKLINLRTREALLHVSAKYSTARNSIAIVLPICQHPVNKNGVIVYDLASDPEQFIASEVDEIAASIFTPASELPDDVARVPLKTVHINKCPVVVPLKTMNEATARRLGIDVERQLQHRDQLLQHIASLEKKTRQVFEPQDFPALDDPDAQLYSGGFFSNADYGRMQHIQQSTPAELAGLEQNYDDSRIPEMLFRYRARNYPDTLGSEEKRQWDEYRRQKFTDPALGIRTINQVKAGIDALRTAPDTTGSQLAVLDELEKYLQMPAISV